MPSIRQPDFSPIPQSQRSREAYLEDLINRVADLTLYSSTSLPEAHSMCMSDVDDFYRSTSFSGYRKMMEGKQKLSTAYIERIDNVVKSINGLGNALVKMMKRG